MAAEEPEFRIYPTTDGVVLDLSALSGRLPTSVMGMYHDILDVAIPDYKGYIATLESDGNIHIGARGVVITNPRRFAHVQLKVARLAKDLAWAFINAYERGAFKSRPENAE